MCLETAWRALGACLERLFVLFGQFFLVCFGAWKKEKQFGAETNVIPTVIFKFKEKTYPNPYGEGFLPPPYPLHGFVPLRCWRYCCSTWAAGPFKNNREISIFALRPCKRRPTPLQGFRPLGCWRSCRPTWAAEP